jgi:hypothetical protein
MPPTPDPSAIISQLATFAGKLSDAIEDSEPFGGLTGLRSNMRPATSTRLVAELRMLRDEIGEQLADFDRPPPRPARKNLLRRRANRPEPIAR